MSIHYFDFEDCVPFGVDYEIIRRQPDVGIMSDYIDFGQLYYMSRGKHVMVNNDKFMIDWDKVEREILG